MKNMIRLGLVLSAALALAACFDSGGSSDPGPGGSFRLDSGTYDVSNAGLNPDECGFGQGFYEQLTTVDVVVNGDRTSLDLDYGGQAPLTYTLTGNDMHDPSSPGETQIDCTQPDTQNGGYLCGDNPYTCMITRNVQFDGMVTGTNAFTLVDVYTFAASGAQCSAVSQTTGLTFPCETNDRGDFTL